MRTGKQKVDFESLLVAKVVQLFPPTSIDLALDDLRRNKKLMEAGEIPTTASQEASRKSDIAITSTTTTASRMVNRVWPTQRASGAVSR